MWFDMYDENVLIYVDEKWLGTVCCLLNISQYCFVRYNMIVVCKFGTSINQGLIN